LIKFFPSFAQHDFLRLAYQQLASHLWFGKFRFFNSILHDLLILLNCKLEYFDKNNKNVEKKFRIYFLCKSMSLSNAQDKIELLLIEHINIYLMN